MSTDAPIELADALEILDRTPDVLRTLLDGISDPWSTARESPRAWSPREVLGHLIHGELTDWMPRTRWILDHGDSRPFAPFDRAGHATFTEWSLVALLDEFARLRRENLAALRDLSLDRRALERHGAHPALGRVTLSQLLAAWTVHDLNHIDQIVRTLAARYRSATGPWNDPDYLGVLHRRKDKG
jgi:hypothetical protein